LREVPQLGLCQTITRSEAMKSAYRLLDRRPSLDDRNRIDLNEAPRVGCKAHDLHGGRGGF
jgi:hypothetical protein